MHILVAEHSSIYTALLAFYPDILQELKDIIALRYGHTIQMVLVEDRKADANESALTRTLMRGEADMLLFPKLYDKADDELEKAHISVEVTVAILGSERLATSVGDVMGAVMNVDIAIWFLAAIVLFTAYALNVMLNAMMSRRWRHLDQNHTAPSNDNNFLTFFGLFLYQGSSRNPRHISSRVLLTFFTFFGLIFVCYLYAEMKTSVTIVRPKYLKTIDDVLAEKHLVPVLLATMVDLVREDSTAPSFRRLWKRLRDNPKPSMTNFESFPTSDEIQHVLASLQGHDGVYIAEVAGMQIFVNALCQLCCWSKNIALMSQVIEGDFLYFWLFRRNMEPEKRQYLFKIMRRSQYHGLLKNIIHKTEQGTECAKKDSGISEMSMDYVLIESLSTIFKCWATGLIVSTLCFLGELCSKKIFR